MMRVDRSQFLWLTACLATGSGCSASPPQSSAASPTRPTVDTEQTTVATPSTTASAATLVSAAEGTAPASGPTATLTARAGDGDGGSGEADEFDELDRRIDELDRQQVACDRSPVERARQQQALHHIEEMPRPFTSEAEPCRQLQEPPGPPCEDYTLAVTECFQIVSYLEPPVARKTMACLSRKSGTRGLCRQSVVADCARAAMRNIRPQPQTAQVCEQAAALCRRPDRPPGPPLSQHGCQRLLSAVRCWQKPETAECLASQCSVRQCLEPVF